MVVIAVNQTINLNMMPSILQSSSFLRKTITNNSFSVKVKFDFIETLFVTSNLFFGCYSLLLRVLESKEIEGQGIKGRLVDSHFQ